MPSEDTALLITVKSLVDSGTLGGSPRWCEDHMQV